MMGVDVATFHLILERGFAELWNSTPITCEDVHSHGAPQLQKHSLDAAGGSGFMLHYLNSTMSLFTLQQVFALVPSMSARYLIFGLKLLHCTPNVLRVGGITRWFCSFIHLVVLGAESIFITSSPLVWFRILIVIVEDNLVPHLRPNGVNLLKECNEELLILIVEVLSTGFTSTAFALLCFGGGFGFGCCFGGGGSLRSGGLGSGRHCLKVEVLIVDE
jgi:hypothetical protein